MNFATGAGSGVLIPVSRRRRLLSIYLDFVLFSVPWGLLDHFLRDVDGWRALSGPAQFTSFILLELIVHKAVHWSPGQWLLSIQPMDQMGGMPISDGPHAPRRFGVPTSILSREHWMTLLAGTLMLLDGAKGLVRWSMFTPTAPYFGAIPPEAQWPWIAALDGAIECAIAYLIFRLRPAALPVGVTYSALSLVSIVMSWNLWDAWAAESIVRRRAYQGIPVRGDEIEKMQAFTPELFVITACVGLIGLTIVGILIVRRNRQPVVAMDAIGGQGAAS